MRRGAEATRAGFEAGMRATRPGMWEYELEALIEQYYRMAGLGARRLSVDRCRRSERDDPALQHHRDQLRDGDLVLVDSGAEYELYATDVTRTWPVNGRFMPSSARSTTSAGGAEGRHRAGAAGQAVRRVPRSCAARAVEGLVDLRLLEGSLDEIVEKETYKDYYPHRTGHYLGLDTHDVGRYRNRRRQAAAARTGHGRDGRARPLRAARSGRATRASSASACGSKTTCSSPRTSRTS